MQKFLNCHGDVLGFFISILENISIWYSFSPQFSFKELSDDSEGDVVLSHFAVHENQNRKKHLSIIGLAEQVSFYFCIIKVFL